MQDAAIVMRLITTVALVGVVLGVPSAADAQDYFSNQNTEEEISFRVDKPRTTTQRIVIASLFGGAVVFGGVGLGFHLDANSKADEVNASGEHTGLVWTLAREDTRKAALRSRVLAIGGYSVGAGFAIAGLVAYIATDPGSEVVTVGSQEDTGGKAAIVPVPGGAMIGGSWTF